jgi:hypothetical protein
VKKIITIISATLYFLGTWFVSGIYVINTLHKGDSNDDDDDDDNNNINNRIRKSVP